MKNKNFSFFICFYARLFVTLQRKLGYGVMVTLQILVLSFQVRILVSQLFSAFTYLPIKGRFFCFINCFYLATREKNNNFAKIITFHKQ